MWRWSRRNPLDRAPRLRGGGRVLGQYMGEDSCFIHPDIVSLMDKEQRDWGKQMRKLKASGVPTAGLGFAGPVQPNTEPVVAPATVALAASTETNLYTPATTTNAAWALIPVGTIRSPQSFRVVAAGTIQTSAASLTAAFTSRIGTSGTPASNASLGATGAVALPSTLTTLWWYEAHWTVTAAGSTTGKAAGFANVMIGNAAAGSITSTTSAISGITIASAVTIDTTIQQGYVISVTGGATTTVTPGLQQFTLIAWD